VALLRSEIPETSPSHGLLLPNILVLSFSKSRLAFDFAAVLYVYLSGWSLWVQGLGAAIS